MLLRLLLSSDRLHHPAAATHRTRPIIIVQIYHHGLPGRYFIRRGRPLLLLPWLLHLLL